MHFNELFPDVGHPVAYYPRVAKAVGNVHAAIFICQFVYWTGKQRDPDGWIYKKQVEIEEETGLSRREQETARKKLKTLGLISEKFSDLPRRLYYRVNLEQMNQFFTQAFAEKEAKTTEPLERRISAESAIKESPNSPFSNGESRHPNIYTKTTHRDYKTGNTNPDKRMLAFAAVPPSFNPLANEEEQERLWHPEDKLTTDKHGWLILPNTNKVASGFREEASHAKAIAIRKTQIWICGLGLREIELIEDEDDTLLVSHLAWIIHERCKRDRKKSLNRNRIRLFEK
jgi:hypothetical protein